MDGSIEDLSFVLRTERHCKYFSGCSPEEIRRSIERDRPKGFLDTISYFLDGERIARRTAAETVLYEKTRSESVVN